MLVPKLRFKEFNTEYKNNLLSEITSNVASGKVLINTGFGKYNVYGSTGIINKAPTFDYSGKKILVARVGANAGTVNKINEKCCISDNTLVIEVNSIIENDYLYYYLDYYNLKRLIFGSGQPLITGGQLKKINVNFPNEKEQIKIANFLSLLDKKIELQTKKIEVLKLYKKGINNIILNYSDHSFKIKDLIVEYNNKTTINNQYNILSSTASGIVLQNTYFNKQTASNNNIGYKIVPKGYITYRSMSDTGEFHFNIQNIIDNGIVSPAYPVFQVKNDLVNKEYFINYINECQNFKNKILSAKEGGTRFALSLSKLSSITVNLPSIEKQNHYSKLLLNLNKKIECEGKKLYVLQLYKKGLMQNMFA